MILMTLTTIVVALPNLQFLNILQKTLFKTPNCVMK